MEQFQFKKKYGQNFLKDDTIPSKIVSYSQIPEDTLVIEIGPGAGALTKQLASASKEVLAYEIDTSLEEILDQNLMPYSNIKIIYDDFLTRDIKQDLENYQYKYLYVIANLPYYITVFLNYYFEMNQLFVVSRNCFVPKPNVDSVILSLTRKKELLPVNDFCLFSKIVRDSFQYKRKNLKNNLKGYDLSLIETVLSKFNYQLTTRAEELPLEVFVEISNILSK